MLGPQLTPGLLLSSLRKLSAMAVPDCWAAVLGTEWQTEAACVLAEGCLGEQSHREEVGWRKLAFCIHIVYIFNIQR